MTLTEQDQALLKMLSAKQAGAVIHRLLGVEVSLDKRSETAYLAIENGVNRRGKDRQRKRKQCGNSLENPQKVRGISVESHKSTPPFLPPSSFPPTPPLSSPPYNPPTTTTAASADEAGIGEVMGLFLDRVNAAPSPLCMDELSAFTKALSAPVVKKAICYAIDKDKTSWSYIKAMLQNYRRNGVTSLEALEQWEESRERSKKHGTAKDSPPNEAKRSADEAWGIRSAFSIGD